MYGVLKPKSTARPRQKANELAGFRQYIDRQYVLPAVYTSWYTYNFARLRLPLTPCVGQLKCRLPGMFYSCSTAVGGGRCYETSFRRPGSKSYLGVLSSATFLICDFLFSQYNSALFSVSCFLFLRQKPHVTYEYQNREHLS